MVGKLSSSKLLVERLRHRPARYVSTVDSANGINYAQNATYAPFGGLTGMTHDSAPITVSNSYNERLQPVNLSASTTSATIMSLSYDFHRANGDNGNVFQIVNNLDNGRTQSFTYDGLNRIYTAQSQATSGSMCWGQGFNLDSWGNLTNVNVTKCSALPLNAPATVNNQISGYCYDKAGNLLGTNSCPNPPYTPTYIYDAENRLITANGNVSYKYDGDGNRVSKSTGVLYWGEGPLGESDASGTAGSWKEYVFLNGKRIARRDASDGSLHFFFSNHLGSTSVVTNGTGGPEGDIDYTPYGSIAYGSSADHYLFTGKERDSESGLDNFGARYDASSLGRFMTPDWAAKPTTVPYAVFGDPQTLNLYAYVRNNPLSRAELDGHCADHYKDGTCKVNVDSATGQAGAKAGKQLESVLNKYDKAVNALNDKDKFNIKDSNGKVIGSMTGKEIKAVWNGTSF